MNSVDPKHIENFRKDSGKWWDPDGPFKPLHRLNPVRIAYIRDRICNHYKIDSDTLTPLKKLDIIDIGCGGGLVCEPLSRLGGNLTGIDADDQAIKVAGEHAKSNELNIKYLNTTSDALAEKKKRYDVVLALEIIEHVSSPEEFVRSCADLCKPGGIVIFSTLNRTLKSYALGIMAAEHILRWVPKGTHEWNKFIKPSELAAMMRSHSITPSNQSGLVFSPLSGEFKLSEHDLDVNYFICGERTQ